MENPESALSLLLAQTKPHNRKEILPLASALGRVLAQPVTAPIPLPPFNRSPLDGYAYRAADTLNATADIPVSLTVIGELCAGSGDTFTVNPGEAVRIMTGAPVPEGCDCVIRQEVTREEGGRVLIPQALASGANVCLAGEDVALGSAILAPGQRLRAAHLGVLGSLGIGSVEVFQPVRAALLCTGDELVSPGLPLPKGKIYNANEAMLCARLAELHVEYRILPAVGDDISAAAEALLSALEWADVLLTTGGVSVGKKDILHDVYEAMGIERLFWRVNMKPGSPLLTGLLQNKLVISLSGNPFAATACFELFAKPVLMLLAGDAAPCNPCVLVPYAGETRKLHPSRRMIRARFDGRQVRIAEGNHTSGALASMMGCNCFIDVSPDREALQEGDMVKILALEMSGVADG